MGQNYFDPFYSLIHQSLTIIFHEQQRSQLHPVDYLLIENCDLCHVINCYLQPNTAYNFMLSRSISDLTILTLIIQLQQIQSTLFASTCHAMPFPACVLKKKRFLRRWYCGKKRKYHSSHQHVHNAFFSLRSEKKHFLWCWYCGKKEIAARVNMSCNAFFSLHSEKNIFSDVDIVEQKKSLLVSTCHAIPFQLVL